MQYDQPGPGIDYDEFVRRVRRGAGLQDDAAADDLTRATLLTLGERLTGGEADALGAQLPTELANHLRDRGGSPSAAPGFGAEEFVRRVRERQLAPASLEEARGQVRAVLVTLREAVAPTAYQSFVSQLPGDFETLLP